MAASGAGMLDKAMERVTASIEEVEMMFEMGISTSRNAI